MKLNKQNIRIELTITTWIQQQGYLFQYNSNQIRQKQHFISSIYHLQISHNKPIYYFFHVDNRKIKDKQYQFLLERRKQPISKFDKFKCQINRYKLIGGIKIFKKQIEKNQFKIFITPLEAKNIQQSRINKKIQQFTDHLPYLIIRSFNKGYPLKPQQLIRFGKSQFHIIDVKLKHKRQYELQTNQDKILNLDEKYKFQNEDKQSCIQSQQIQCRICYSNQQDQDNMLLTPCRCKGSSKYIHLQCLKDWIQLKLKNMKKQSNGGFYQIKLLFCEVCKQNFPKTIIKNNKKYGLLKFLEQINPYISIKPQKENKQQNNQSADFHIVFQQTNNIKIGRLRQNGVTLQDNSVSRNHAQLKIIQNKNKEDIIAIFDSESKYGTLLYQKNAEIPISHTLRAIQIGNSVFSYKIAKFK